MHGGGDAGDGEQEADPGHEHPRQCRPRPGGQSQDHQTHHHQAQATGGDVDMAPAGAHPPHQEGADHGAGTERRDEQAHQRLRAGEGGIDQLRGQRRGEGEHGVDPEAEGAQSHQQHGQLGIRAEVTEADPHRAPGAGGDGSGRDDGQPGDEGTVGGGVDGEGDAGTPRHEDDRPQGRSHRPGQIEGDGVEGDGLGEVLGGDEGRDQRLLGRGGEGVGETHHQGGRQHRPGEGKPLQAEGDGDESQTPGGEGGGRLRPDEEAAAIEAVGGGARPRRQHQRGEELGHSHHPHHERGAGDGEHHHGSRDLLEPGADVGGEVAGEVRPEGAVGHQRPRRARG